MYFFFAKIKMQKYLVVSNKSCIFAATVPATPLLESVPRQDFVFLYICSTTSKL